MNSITTFAFGTFTTLTANTVLVAEVLDYFTSQLLANIKSCFTFSAFDYLTNLRTLKTVLRTVRGNCLITFVSVKGKPALISAYRTLVTVDTFKTITITVCSSVWVSLITCIKYFVQTISLITFVTQCRSFL